MLLKGVRYYDELVAQVLRGSHQKYSLIIPQDISVQSHINETGATNYFYPALPIFHQTNPMPKPTISVAQTFTLVPPRFNDQLSVEKIPRIRLSYFDISLTEIWKLV